MPIPKLEKQQVTGALKATRSNDPDVLFAKKEELLFETRRLKLLGIMPIIVGGAMSLTIIGAFVGIPIMIFGFWMRSRIKRNTANADEALAEYINSALPPEGALPA